MKKYFYHDGQNQFGPFDLEGLRSKNLIQSTPIWYQGLEKWTPAGQIEELKVLFEGVPPPFHAEPINTQDYYTPPYYQQENNKRSYKKPLLIGVSVLLGIFLFAAIIKNSNTPKSDLHIAAARENSDSSAGVQEKSDKEKLAELEKKELERKRLSEERFKKNMNYRNNWNEYIKAEPNPDYKINSFGGVYNLRIAVANNTDKIIDEVIVAIDYYKASGSVYTRLVPISNIQPESYSIENIPDTDRGLRIQTRIIKITSRSLQFCYNEDYYGVRGISGDASDPWFCK